MEALIGMMDEAVAMLVAAVVLGYIGSWMVPMVQRMPQTRWTRIYLETAWLHPILAGALLGLSPSLPVPEAMGDSWEASILWYAIAGVISLPVYRRLMRRVEGGQ